MEVLASLTKVLWNSLSLCTFSSGSLICSIRSRSSSSCLERTSIVLFLQQLPISGMDFWAVELFGDSEWSSPRALEISLETIEWVGDFPRHSFLKCPFLPHLKHFPFALGLRCFIGVGFPFL